MVRDVAVVGAGPAGLAVAIAAAMRGLTVTVLERRALPYDKACGEGLMPAGVQVLDALEVRSHLAPEAFMPLESLRYVREDGVVAEGRLPGGGALGIRRRALSAALSARALEVGVELRACEPLLSHERTDDGVRLRLDHGDEVRARLLVAADGLDSPLRRRMGLDAGPPRRRRFGMRTHFRARPWARSVEIHLSARAEAYVTPVGPQCVGVALLWDADRGRAPPRFEHLPRDFPWLGAHLAGAPADGALAGAGPFHRRSRTRTTDRFALVGDAAGYIDPLTGEGVALALSCALALAGFIPEALGRRAGRECLWGYERAFLRAWRPYARLTKAVLALERRHRMRNEVLELLAGHRRLFDEVLSIAL